MKMTEKDKKNSSLEHNLLVEKTTFEKFEENLKNSIFGVLFVLLKEEDGSVYLELVLILFELLQLMVYPFNQYLVNVWKKETSLTIYNFLNLIQVVVFFQDNYEMYIIIFYVCVLLVVLVILDIVYVSISFSRNKFNHVWPLHVLRSIVSFIVTVLFMPIVEYFMAIMECQIDDQGVYVNGNIQGIICWEGSHIIHSIIGVISSILFISICAIVQLTFYEVKISIDNHDAKTNSKADVFSLIVQLCLIIMYSFMVSQPNLQWIVIIMTFILSLFQFYIFYDEQPFYEDKIMKAFLLYCGIFCWHSTVLLLCKALENTSFNGGLELFFIGIPIVSVIILCFKDVKLSLLLTNLNKFEKGEMVSKQVRFFLDLVDKKDTERISKIRLRGYIFLHNEQCSLIDCPLEKYVKELESGKDIIAYLYQHAQYIFQLGISKFPYCTSLRMSYAYFLVERLNNRVKSLMELKTAEKYNPSFEEQFIIYRLKKLFEEQSSESVDDGDDEENLDVVSNIAYKNHFNLFVEGLKQSTALYIEFWSSIRITNENQEDVAKLNDIGTKINKVVEDIKTNFEKMQKLKHNDELVIRLYSDFLLDILNEKEKGLYFKNRLNEIEGTNDDIHISNDKNIDLDHIISDDFQYVMISADIDKPNIIKKLTTGICSLFGYSKDELIGQPLDVLMPEQYQKMHRKILLNKLDEYKKFIANSLHSKTKKTFKSIYKEIFGVAKNKSKYLIPISIRANLITSADQSEIYFIGKISKVSSSLNNHLNQNPLNFNNLNNQNNITTTDSVCYVLTDNNFIVQNFSPNSIFLMGLKAKYNGNLDITRHIKELYEDPELNKIENNLLNNINENLDSDSMINGMNINKDLNNNFIIGINQSKRLFFNARYRSYAKITWRFPAKLKEKVAFMQNIIRINEKKNENENPSRKNSEKSISSKTGRGAEEVSPRSWKDISQNSKVSVSQNLKMLKESKEIIEIIKKSRAAKDIDFAAYVQESFMMSVSDIYLLNNLEGFVFRFETSVLKNSSNLNTTSSNSNSKPAGRKSGIGMSIPANININFNFNSNTRNLSTNLQYSIEIKDSDLVKNNLKGNILSTKKKSVKKNNKEKGLLSEINNGFASPQRKTHQQEKHEEIQISANFVKNPTFSENVDNNLPPIREDYKNEKNSAQNHSPLPQIRLIPHNFQDTESEKNNPEGSNINSAVNSPERRPKGLGSTNWIANIRKKRELRKKQMREMKDLKIDKNYIPDTMNEFHLDPKEGVYRKNPKNPENYVEFAKQFAEQKISENMPKEESENDTSSESNSDSGSDSDSDSKSGSYSKSRSDDQSENRENSDHENNDYINNAEKFPKIIQDNPLNENSKNFENRLTKANNIYDVNILNSNEFENQNENDTSNNPNNKNQVSTTGFKINLNRVTTKILNITEDKNDDKKLGGFKNSHNDVSSDSCSFRSEGSKNGDMNNKRNMLFIGHSNLDNSSQDTNQKDKKRNISSKKIEEKKKLEQPKANLIKKRGNVNPNQKSGNQKVDSKKLYIRQKPLYNSFDDYYFVNIKPIKFFVYDFKSDKLVEINDEFRQSQVEFKKNENYGKNNKLMRKQTKRKKKSKNEQDKKEKDDQINNEFILMKQLEYALSKQETQPEITRLRIISTMNFFIIISVILIMFIFMIIAQNNLTDNINLISNSFNLITNSISGVFFSRELILLNNPNYNNFIPERMNYIKNITDSLLIIFSNSSDLYNNIMIKEISINEELNNKNTKPFSLTYSDFIPIQVIQDSSFYRKLNSSLDSAFKEANTALYHIANTDINDLTPNNKDSYFYIFNIMNSILLNFFNRSFIYVEYIQNEIDSNIRKFLYVLGVTGIIGVIAFISIYYSFLAVILRKQSYLEVFFEIGEDVIKKSIENCENFSTKLQIDKQYDEANVSKSESINKDEEEDEEESENQENQNPFSHTSENTKTGTENRHLETTPKKKASKSAETVKFTIKLIIVLTIFFSYFILVNFLCSSYMNTFSGYFTFYNTTSYVHSSDLLILNVLREYLFDKNTYYQNVPINYKINEKINDFYEFKLENNRIINKYIDTFPSNFSTSYINILNYKLCDHMGTSLNSYLLSVNLNCENFMYNSTNFGLSVLLTNFIEEIRQIKFKYDYMIDSQQTHLKKINTLLDLYYINKTSIYSMSYKNDTSIKNEKEDIMNYLSSLTNNTYEIENNSNFKNKLSSIFSEILKNEIIMTLINYDDFSDVLLIEYPLENLSSFSIFNDLILRNLNIINNFIIKPSYDNINNNLITNMIDILKLYSFIFICMFGLFITSVILFYLFDWRPFENNLDSTVI